MKSLSLRGWVFCFCDLVGVHVSELIRLQLDVYFLKFFVAHWNALTPALAQGSAGLNQIVITSSENCLKMPHLRLGGGLFFNF